MASRTYDVVIYGATGFTGELVARYYLQNEETAFGSPSSLKWAIAGRSASKLEAIKSKLKQKVPSVSAEVIDMIPIIVADSKDAKALDSMAKSTKVVLSLVGPYKAYGSILVEKCVENGTHYCDLTGELLWAEEMIQKYQETAKKTGAILVNCCGFESVPSDMTTFALSEYVLTKVNKPVGEISLFFTNVKGAASGGTMASVMTVFETASNADLLRMNNPFFITNEETMARKKQQNLVSRNSSSLLMKKERDLNKWSANFIGGSVNSAIVHRSNLLLQNRYGEKLVYRERLAMGGFLMLLGATLGVLLIGPLLYFRWTRAIVKRFAPAPGEGPSEDMQKNGFFTAKSFAYTEDGALVAKAVTHGSGDPGYNLTSKMIGECAQCLAKGLVNEGVSTGGFYTPASAFGHHLLSRLQTKNIFKIDVQGV